VKFCKTVFTNVESNLTDISRAIVPVKFANLAQTFSMLVRGCTEIALFMYLLCLDKGTLLWLVLNVNFFAAISCFQSNVC
jgi:hypothetical protein